MPRKGVPYGGGICSLRERIAELFDLVGEKLHSINGVQGDGQGNVQIASGDDAVVITNDQIGHKIKVSLDNSKLPAVPVSSVNGQTGTVVLNAGNIPTQDANVQTDIDAGKEGLKNCNANISTEREARQAADAALQTAIEGRQLPVKAGTDITIGTDGRTINAAAQRPVAGDGIAVSGRTVALASSGATAGTYGGASAIPQLTVDAYGRITKAATVAPAAQTPTAGTGIAVSGRAVSLATSGVTAGTYGSNVAVPRLVIDAHGRVTGASTQAIYPPTTAGTAGQLWQSDGSGQGVWQTLDTAPTADSVKAVTSGGVKAAIDAEATARASADSALQANLNAVQDAVQADYVKKTGSAQTVTSQIMVPTTATGTRDTQIANGTRIQNDLDNYATMVRTANAQTIGGVKTFTSKIVVAKSNDSQFIDIKKTNIDRTATYNSYTDVAKIRILDNSGREMFLVDSYVDTGDKRVLQLYVFNSDGTSVGYIQFINTGNGVKSINTNFPKPAGW